ncbi:MAG: dihydrodipicolinate synthase family protein [Planctomycetes bacterium]|nr:dihydrodipicolinate synthase family protein [Planctomycetota bacterium]
MKSLKFVASFIVVIFAAAACRPIENKPDPTPAEDEALVDMTSARPLHDWDYPSYFRGAIVPMMTPYSEDASEIDIPCLEKFTDWLCESNLSALFCVSGMGQWNKLTFDEKKIVIETVVKAADGRKAVIAGITSILEVPADASHEELLENLDANAEETIQLGKFAREVGADAVAVAIPAVVETIIRGDPSPYDSAEAQDVLYRYYSKVDQGLDIPIAVYDRLGIFHEDTMRKLLDRDGTNVEAMKYRTGDMTRMLLMCEVAGSRAAILTGIEFDTLPTLAVGGVGVIGGGPNCFPNLCALVVSAFEKGDLELARKAQLLNIEAERKTGALGGSIGRKMMLRELCGIPFNASNRGDTPREVDPATIDELYSWYRTLGVNENHEITHEDIVG